ncbi:hypothetical protein M758_11G092400 [Ceratodon purpureus]|nr:hypothetical protein M758_11G092400 [Ceratodon purpureus]
MASQGLLLPWCAARKCPQSPKHCMSYINQNINNQTAQNFVACCKIQCGITSANDDILEALQCGGATKATAVGTIAYLVILLCMGILILVVGPFRVAKNATFIVVTIGSLVFMTLTGVFVINVTSPFVVLQSVPALGAMNVAVFSYFFSGFRYGAGLGYECGPLVVFVTTAYALYKSIGLTPEDGPIRTSNNLALAMFAFTLSWIVHSVSYRLYGYRVEWRLGQKKKGELEVEKLDPRFHMGAAQGHPTWRTPMGQSTSVIMTALAWSVFRYVWKDLALQECRPDWVFQMMLFGAPILISVTILWNFMSGIRCRTVEGLETETKLERRGLRRWLGRRLGKIFSENVTDFLNLGQQVDAYTSREKKKSSYPGFQIYKDFYNEEVWKAYVQAAALQWMERNSLFAEDVPDSRLTWIDYTIGSVAWALALCGLIISSPVFFSLMIVVEIFGRIFEALQLKILVQTEVKDEDRISAAEVVEQCYVGENLSRERLSEWAGMFGKVNDTIAQRSINLHTLLDNTGPVELYNLL